MKIRLLHDWMGNRKGTWVDLVDRVAQELIERGTAVKPKKMGRPPRDKMVRTSRNK